MSVRWLLLLSCLAAALLCSEACSSSKKSKPKPAPPPPPPPPTVPPGSNATLPPQQPPIGPKRPDAETKDASNNRVANWLIAVLPLFLLFQLLKQQSAMMCQI
ncbi:hypothetical protein BOX15_Mlig012955g2 [Macrostomum lignano]|uniref:Uncharacterized protein n=2 Tax=Macrostomum lignano TaxID=282301 RepID=A0A1I8H6Q6_9PLAT|nr:hypothetical protein BOX15_Mlig012955g3 [Macrostomum lignano]PAA85135.1 hypothetical protein BOX15_Mlig012955g2 [Macrostomum lignano]